MPPTPCSIAFNPTAVVLLLHRYPRSRSRHSCSPQIDLAPHVGASLDVMRRDSATMRESGSTLFTSVRQGEGVDGVVDAILSAWKVSGAAGKNKAQASV